MKSKLAACLLTFFFGCWGIHWFYLGNNKKGVVYLCIGIVGLFFIVPLIITIVLSFIDFLTFIFGDFDEKYNSAYNYNPYNAHYTAPTAPPYQQPTPSPAPVIQAASSATSQTEHKQNPTASNGKATKRCPYCGEEILAVAKKCKHCGEWLNKEPEKPKKKFIDCPVCGEQIEKGMEECPYCNEKIS